MVILLRHFSVSYADSSSVCRLTLHINCVIVQLCLLYIFTKGDTVTVPVYFFFIKWIFTFL